VVVQRKIKESGIRADLLYQINIEFRI